MYTYVGYSNGSNNSYIIICIRRMVSRVIIDFLVLSCASRCKLCVVNAWLCYKACIIYIITVFVRFSFNCGPYVTTK